MSEPARWHWHYRPPSAAVSEPDADEPAATPRSTPSSDAVPCVERPDTETTTMRDNASKAL